MKLLQIVPVLGHGGGITHVATELQHAWRSAGIDCRVLAMSVAESHSADAHLVVPWALPAFRHYLGRLVAVPLFTIAATLRLRRSGSGRIVISHGDSLEGDVLVIHQVAKVSIAERRRNGNLRWLLNPLHAWSLLRDFRMITGLRFQRYVAVSSRVSAELQRHHGVPASRIVVIPNGVNLNRFKPDASDKTNVRLEFSIPPQAPLLLFVGHEFGRKGLAYVIDALGHLPPNVHLLVIGKDEPGPYRAMASKAGIAANRVIFAGSRSDMHHIYPAADAFVFPTYYEAFPLVVLEAMAAGLPLFATRVGGIEECLLDGENGFFIERDGSNIAARLAPALADPALLERLGQAARRTAEAYAWPLIAQRYLEMLQTLEGATPTPSGG